MPLDKLPTKMSAGFGLSMIDRAVKEKYARRCSKEELQSIKDYFAERGGIRCIYCGDSDPSRWDHLHAVSKGGDTVPGNLVPSCGSCDDSKQDREVRAWVTGSSKKRPPLTELKRIEKEITEYQVHFGYTAVPFDQKLPQDQRDVYVSFQRELQALREHLETVQLIKKKK